MPSFTPRKSPNNRLNELARARASITRYGNVRSGLTVYKETAPSDELQRVLPRLLAMPAYHALVWPEPLPRRTSSLHQVGLTGHSGYIREIEWLSLSLLGYASSINRFIKRAASFEHRLLFATDPTTHVALDEIETEFGISLWLIHRRIAVLQQQQGLKAQREYAASVLADEAIPSLLRYIVSWASFKAEDSISGDSFYRLLDDVRPSSPGFSDLMHVLLGSCPAVDHTTVGHSLAYLDILPLVDRYKYFVRFLQVIVAQGLPEADYSRLRLAIRALSRQVADPELHRLSLAIGASDEIVLPTRLGPLLDAYVTGNLSVAEELSRTLVQEQSSVDALHLAVKLAVSSEAPVDLSFLPPGSLIEQIGNDLVRLFGYSSNATTAASRLLKLTVNHSDTDWGSSLTLLVRRQRHDERLFDPTRVQRFHALRAADDMPILCFAYPKSARNAYLAQFSNGSGNPWLASSEMFQLLHAPEHTTFSREDLASERNGALIALRQGRHDDAAELLQGRRLEANTGIRKLEAGVLLAEAFLRGGHLLRCAQTCASLCLGSEYLVHLLPIERLITSLIEAEESTEMPVADRADIAIVIAFDLFSRFVSPSKDPERGDAFNDFLIGSSIQIPSQLRDSARPIAQLELRYFLQQVCVPDVLDQCYGLRSSREVEDERARILVQLTEIYNDQGQAAPPNLNEELQQIRTRQVIRDTTHQLDQSKIFVDTEGIRRVLGNQLKESWARYRLMGLESGSGAASPQVIKQLQVAGDRLSIVVSMPLTERNKLFERMFAEIRDLFASSKVYGLDANLSTNIRHGYVLRELRKPFVIAHLVTNKLTESSEYKENTYWLERIEDEASATILQTALNSLSQKVDAEIEFLIDRVLRVWGDGSPEGVFDFEMSHAVLHHLQVRAEDCDTADEFLDLTFEVLWQRTNYTLRAARSVLLNGTLRSLNGALAELQQELEAADFDDDASALVTAVNLVRPEVRSAVDRVASWFTLSGSRDYQDYAVKIAYDAALATVATYYNDLEINTVFEAPTTLLLRGWTLPHLTRLLSNLLENVAKHSQIAEGAVTITCRAVADEGSLSVYLANSLAPSIDRSALVRKIDSINADFGKDAVSSLVAKEGSSGYPKIWKILAHDLRRDHDLHVHLDRDGNFAVNLLIDSKDVVL